MVDFFGPTLENVPIAHRNVAFYTEIGALFVHRNPDIDVQSFGIVSFFPCEEITPKMATVQVSNKSKVTGMGAVYWQYFEDLDKIPSSEKSPLHIKKELFIKKRSESGEILVPINKVPISLGDLLTIRMEITSSDNLAFVHLKDMRASGLEPIDVISEYKWQDGLGYYQSTKDVATHFFFDRLPKGTYVFEYEVRANNSGDFSNGITTIQSMYAPEFSAHSQGERIKIK